MDQRAPERDALSLTARELARTRPGARSREAQAI